MLETWVQSLGRKIPWSREWQPTPVFLYGEFLGEGNLAGYSPWSHKESDTTERLMHMCAHTHTHTYTQTQTQTHTHTHTHTHTLMGVFVVQGWALRLQPEFMLIRKRGRAL